MAATRTTLSIWPERTDARVGLQVEPRALAEWADVGLRSKQGRGREGLYSGRTISLN
jgi:hypothetical protein